MFDWIRRFWIFGLSFFVNLVIEMLGMFEVGLGVLFVLFKGFLLLLKFEVFFKVIVMMVILFCVRVFVLLE